MRLSDFKIQTKILMVAAAPTLMAVAVGGVAMWGLTQMEQSAWWVEHTYEVTGAAETLVGAAVNMETGMRGFAISGEDTFLEPYIAGGKTFDETIESLKQTVSDNPPQVARLEEAQAVMADWRTKVADAQIAMRRTVGVSATMDDVVTFAANAGGKVFFDKFRGLMSEFIELESSLMGERKLAATGAKQTATWSIIGGAIAALVLGGGLAAWIGAGISGPTRRLTAAMGKIAEGDFTAEVEGGNRRDELGAMAQATLVFRDNGLKIAEMTAEEARRLVSDKESRARMMGELQHAFGTVVDAAIAGDFSKRVDAKFPDKELNGLADSVNSLVETVDTGLSETSAVLGDIAEAKLTSRVAGSYSGAFARLKDDTNAVADKLSDIVGQLRNTSGSLKQATSEILSGANDLAERTTKQAAAIEETSASMEQLATTVVENARRAGSASKTAQGVSDMAEEAGDVMRQSNEAMERISNSSAKISNIIGLIDDIAFQTNLLALNASVEAARAGDAGKGFAVVAVEVRRLAQSAASASAEVKVLIEQSASEVSGGSRLVAAATDRLNQMLIGVKESASLISAISSASQEQSTSISEVSTAIRQMDEMTQHNAALVEQTNAAIEQTEGQAGELDRIVDVFVLDGMQRQAGEPRSASRPANVKAMPARAKSAAKSYLSNGNAAIDSDWNEF
jgi:methyl-accepting chemotaxis protein